MWCANRGCRRAVLWGWGYWFFLLIPKLALDYGRIAAASCDELKVHSRLTYIHRFATNPSCSTPDLPHLYRGARRVSSACPTAQRSTGAGRGEGFSRVRVLALGKYEPHCGRVGGAHVACARCNLCTACSNMLATIEADAATFQLEVGCHSNAML
jgi:hypothetical protein